MRKLDPSPEGWLRSLDALLGGLIHALSNRLAALEGLTGILAHGPEAGSPVVEALQTEVQKLRESLFLLPLLSGRDHEPETFDAAEALDDAARLHRLRIDLREVPLRVEGRGESVVRAPRSAFTHLCLLLLERATLAATEAGGEATARCQGGEAGVELRVSAIAGAGASASPAPPLPDGLATALGAEWIERGEAARWALRLPSLAQVRRREQTADPGPDG